MGQERTSVGDESTSASPPTPDVKRGKADIAILDLLPGEYRK